jgi:hypothetical protein
MHGFTLPDDYLARWTKAHGIAIDDENRAAIRRYLLHGRRIRTTGALSGYVGYSVFTMINTTNQPPFGWLTATFGGYLLGAAVAELWSLRPQPGSVRAAALAPRRMTDYVPRYAVIGIRIVPALTALALIVGPMLSVRYEPGLEPPADREWGAIIGWTIASIVLAVFVETTARRIVRRPQPITSEKLLVVDDAIRSTSLHCLIGAGLAMMLYALSRNLSQILSFGAYGTSPIRSVFGFVMIFAGVATPFVWLHLGIDQPWIVRRSRRNEPVAA